MVDPVTDDRRVLRPADAEPARPSRRSRSSRRRTSASASAATRARDQPQGAARQPPASARRARSFWALRDVDVAIAPGQTVGLIGANGSGKSTLLKVLAGHPAADRPARCDVHGRIASLLELGAGFNGELSGRDNVYLNASLLGLSRRETDELFDSIVEFAELAHKIDDEVKHYSSGQYVRLGFAVAVHVDPDVLLVDEVLAVGDEAFQREVPGQDRASSGDAGQDDPVRQPLAGPGREPVRPRRRAGHGERVFDGEPPTGTLCCVTG